MRISKLLKTILAIVLTLFIWGTRSLHAVGVEHAAAKEAAMPPVAFAGHVHAFLSQQNPSLNDMQLLLKSINLEEAANPENRLAMAPVTAELEWQASGFLGSIGEVQQIREGKFSPESRLVRWEFISHPQILKLLPKEMRPLIVEAAKSARQSIRPFFIDRIKPIVAQYLEETETPDLASDLRGFKNFRGRNPMEVVVAQIPGGLFASKQEALSKMGDSGNKLISDISFVPVSAGEGGLVAVSLRREYPLYEIHSIDLGYIVPFAFENGITSSYWIYNEFSPDVQIRRGLVALMKNVLKKGTSSEILRILDKNMSRKLPWEL